MKPQRWLQGRAKLHADIQREPPRLKQGLGIIVWFSVLLVFFAFRRSNADAAVDVYLHCGGEDTTGDRLCFAVKEQIRASRAFHPAKSPTSKTLCIILATMDASPRTSFLAGTSSAVGIIFTIGPTFAASTVMVVGAMRVKEQAEEILSRADQVATKWGLMR